MSENLGTLLFNGEDRIIQLTLLDATGLAPLNITGWTMEFLLGGSGTTPTIRKALSVTSGVAGECETAAITPAELNGLRSGTQRYVIRRTDAGKNTVVQSGTVPLEITLI